MRRLIPLVFAAGLSGCMGSSYPVPVSLFDPPREPEPVIVPRAEAPSPADPEAEPADARLPRAARPAAVWRPPYVAESVEYVVRSGDTISQIAQSMLGTVRNVPLLLMANPEVGNRNRIAVGQRLLLPKPGYFGGPFLADGERVASVEVIRWKESKREGLLAVHVRGSGPDSPDGFMLLTVRNGRSIPVFSSADYEWSGARFRRYRRGWNWRVVDLDGDGDPDLLASNSFGAGSGTCFEARVFHRRPGGGYARHVLAEAEQHGGFVERRPLYAQKTFAFDVTERESFPGGWRTQPVRVYCRWTGSGFERRTVKCGRANTVRNTPESAGATGGSLK